VRSSTSVEQRIDDYARRFLAASPARGAKARLTEFVVFVLKQGWACIFGAALLAVLGLLIVCGYLVPWSWTGFTGNTFVDWVQLLILPVLFPTVVVPATAAWLTATASRPKHRGGKQVAGPVDPH